MPHAQCVVLQERCPALTQRCPWIHFGGWVVAGQLPRLRRTRESAKAVTSSCGSNRPGLRFGHQEVKLNMPETDRRAEKHVHADIGGRRRAFGLIVQGRNGPRAQGPKGARAQGRKGARLTLVRPQTTVAHVRRHAARRWH